MPKRPPLFEWKDLGLGALKSAPDAGAAIPNFLRVKNVAQVRRFHESLAGYEPTPLISLDALAAKLGLGHILVKDESRRFGLNAFKGLGGSWAIFRLICQRLGLDPQITTFQDLRDPGIRQRLDGTVFVTATDGNHGRGVAWAAGLLGCRAVVYMPKGSAEARAQAIREAGQAEALITDLGYDDAVRLASRQADENGWLLVQDTSWEGYEEIPTWIVQGYTTLAAEAADRMDQLGTAPTHVFLQAGVGAMAGGVLGYLADRYAAHPPLFALAEPDNVACVYASALAADGRAHALAEAGPTIMAGLNCGEPCQLTWPILRDRAHYYFACPDYVAAEGMRQYHQASGADTPIISGESGAVTLGLLLRLTRDPALSAIRRDMGLDANSTVLLINTEGDTDPEAYREIVFEGRYPAPA